MGGERTTEYLTGLSHAHHAPADFGKDLQRFSAYEEGKPIGRFLGAGLPDHGRHTASSAAIGAGLHPPDPPASGTGSFSIPAATTNVWLILTKMKQAQSIINSAFCF